MHVLEFIHLHGNITKVTKQGLEKLYDLTTKHYLHSTNHRETEALLQLMEKRNQFEDLEIERYQQKVRMCTCRNCGQVGHNRCTCPTKDQENVPPTQPASDFTAIRWGNLNMVPIMYSTQNYVVTLSIKCCKQLHICKHALLCNLSWLSIFHYCNMVCLICFHENYCVPYVLCSKEVSNCVTQR